MSNVNEANSKYILVSELASARFIYGLVKRITIIYAYLKF